MNDRDRLGAPRDVTHETPTHLLFELVRLVKRTSAAMFPENPLRLPHLLALTCVSVHGPLSQREISERLRMDAADMVGIVDALEGAGYLERRRDPGDRRRYAVEITEEGRLYLGRSREQRRVLNDAVFAPLAPGELELFKEMMVRVLAHHDERFASVGPGSGPVGGRVRRSAE